MDPADYVLMAVLGATAVALYGRKPPQQPQQPQPSQNCAYHRGAPTKQTSKLFKLPPNIMRNIFSRLSVHTLYCDLALVSHNMTQRSQDTLIAAVNNFRIKVQDVATQHTYTLYPRRSEMTFHPTWIYFRADAPPDEDRLVHINDMVIIPSNGHARLAITVHLTPWTSPYPVTFPPNQYDIDLKHEGKLDTEVIDWPSLKHKTFFDIDGPPTFHVAVGNMATYSLTQHFRGIKYNLIMRFIDPGPRQMGFALYEIIVLVPPLMKALMLESEDRYKEGTLSLGDLYFPCLL